MAENKKKKNEQETETKKVVTKYDRKMEAYKKMQEKEKKEETLFKLGLAAIILAVIAFIASFPIRTAIAVNQAYITVNGQKVTRVEFDYQYALAKNSYINQYGSYYAMFGMTDMSQIENEMYSETLTFRDYFEQLAVDNIITNRALYQKATEAGFVYDTTADYNEVMDRYALEAKEAGSSVDSYLKSMYGSYATVGRLKKIQNDSLYATAYYQELEKQKAPADDEIEKYYKDNADDYDSVDYYLAIVDAEELSGESEESTATTEEATEETDAEVNESADKEATAETVSEAEETVEESAAEEADQTEGADAQNADEAETDESAVAEDGEEAVTSEEETETAETEELSEDEVERIMAIAREKADSMVETVEEEGTLHEKESYSDVESVIRDYVFDSARKAGDTEVIEDYNGHRYMVVKYVKRYLVEDPTVDLYAIIVTASEKNPEDVYNEWKNGAATEDSFKELAVSYQSTDEVFEGIVPSNMEGEMGEWLSAKERANGDVGFFTDEDGYGYIFYFVGKNKPAYYINIKSILTNENMSAYLEEIKAGYTVEDPKKHLAYLHVEETQQTDTSAESADTEATEQSQAE